MFCNIKKILADGVDVDVSITEFYPTIDRLTMVPSSKIAERPFFVFGDCAPDVMSIGPLPEKYILSREEYTKELEYFLEDANRNSRGKVTKFFTEVEQYYQRYLTAALQFAIGGVVSVIGFSDNSSAIPAPEVIRFVPPEGANRKVDIESYWKSLAYSIPNFVSDVSSVVKMYQVYSGDFDERGTVIVSKVLLESRGLKDFVDSIRDGLDRTNLSANNIWNLIQDDRLSTDPAMIPYYKEMMTKYEIDQTTSEGLVPYTFDTYIQKAYKNAGYEDIYGTNTSIVHTLQVRRDRNLKGASII